MAPSTSTPGPRARRPESPDRLATTRRGPAWPPTRRGGSRGRPRPQVAVADQVVDQRQDGENDHEPHADRDHGQSIALPVLPRGAARAPFGVGQVDPPHEDRADEPVLDERLGLSPTAGGNHLAAREREAADRKSTRLNS